VCSLCVHRKSHFQCAMTMEGLEVESLARDSSAAGQS
jgi:hypothetical protein